MNETSFRLRIDYGKIGRLRFLSHLELMRAIERIIRRAQLPFMLSKGFNVHMKHSFGPALPVGTAGLHEELDVWISEYVPADEALKRLRAVTVPDLPINTVRYCLPDTPSIQASLTRASYEAVLKFEDKGEGERFAAAFEAICAQNSITIIKKGKPKEIDLATRLYAPPALTLFDAGMSADVAFELVVTGGSLLRPEALLQATAEDVCITKLVRTALVHEQG